MISVPGKYGATCDGFSRREFLRLGGAGLADAWTRLGFQLTPEEAKEFWRSLDLPAGRSRSLWWSMACP
jgi:hypothetical protein